MGLGDNFGETLEDGCTGGVHMATSGDTKACNCSLAPGIGEDSGLGEAMRFSIEDPVRTIELEEVIDDALDCLLLRGAGAAANDAALYASSSRSTCRHLRRRESRVLERLRFFFFRATASSFICAICLTLNKYRTAVNY